jgi:Protein of unknown function (DUF1566)
MKTILRLFVLLGFILVIPSICSFGQVGINTDNSAPDNSAMLDVKSSSRGLLPPRMTHADLNNISSPAAGLVVYCTDCGSNGLGALTMFMGGTWYKLSNNCLNPPPSPTAGTQVPSTCQIVWNWNPVPGATGYKLNLTDDYATAYDIHDVTTLTQTGLNPSTSYNLIVWAYNTCGHSSATLLSSQTLDGNCIFIGNSYQGGIIFYIDGTGSHGLIAATNYQGNSLQWTYPAISVTTYDFIGSGQVNTNAILAACSDPGTAAKACDTYENNGYSDWFLPSKDELNLMYPQRSFIPDMSSGTYWSSSQYDDNDAYAQDFSTGGQNHISKVGPGYVRAIRKF